MLFWLNECLRSWLYVYVVPGGGVSAMQGSYADRAGGLAQDPTAGQAYGGL